MAEDQVKIFLSYSTSDKSATGLQKALTLIGFECFLAHNDIPKGAKWAEVITREIKQADVFIPILSEHALSSSWVHQECGMAHMLRIIRKSKSPEIIPITVGKAIPPGCLAEYQAISAKETMFGFGGLNLDFDFARKLGKAIADELGPTEAIKIKAITQLLDAKHDECDHILEFLSEFDELTLSELLAIISAANRNPSIIYARRAMQLIAHYARHYKEDLKAHQIQRNAWNKLTKCHMDHLEDLAKKEREMIELFRNSVPPPKN